MTLTIARPRRNAFAVLDEMDKVFSAWRGDWNGADGVGNWMPPVDIYETEGNLVVKAEAPGLEKDNFKVSVENNVLTLSGEKINEMSEKDAEGNCHRTERTYGKFSRSFTLPNNVDVTGVKAKYKNGVLEVSLPKKEEAKPKEISVDVG